MGSAFCSTNTVVRVQVHPDPQKQPGGAPFKLSIDGAIPTRVNPLPAESDSAIAHTTENAQLHLQAPQGTEVQVQVQNFPGWSAFLPTGTRMSMELPAARDLAASAPKENLAIIEIQLPDGAQAELGGSSSIRLEGFADGSYSLFAEGGVRARTADGVWLTLERHLPPLIGGPLVQVTNQQGQVRLRRLAPSTRLQFSPGLVARVAGSSGPDLLLETDVSTPLDLANGATVHLQAQPDGLRFKVTRGYFILVPPGGTGAEPHVWSGQSGSMRWDQELQAMELNADGAPILVALPNQSHAIVQPGSSLQVARLNDRSFAASAPAGKGQLYDPLTRRLLELGEAQTIVRPIAPRAENRLRVTVHPDADGHLMLSAAGGAQRRLTAVEEEWSPDSGHVLRVSNDESLELFTLQAVAGDFLMQLPLANLEFELDQPNAMNWHLSPHRTTARGEALASNPTAVAIRGEKGQLLLSPGGEMMFVAPSWTMGLQPSAVFSEALEPAGSAGPVPVSPDAEGMSWLLGLDPKQVHVPRVQQPPVSIVE